MTLSTAELRTRDLPRTAFHLPTKPYSVIDLINRRAAATGSVNYAIAASMADYNGHFNTVDWNDYRGYYVGQYNWGERRVWSRTADIENALNDAIREFARQGRGAAMSVMVLPEDAAIVRINFPMFIEGKETSKPWITWQHGLVGEACGMHQEHLLLRATDEAHFRRLQGRVTKPDGSWTTDLGIARAEWVKVKDLPVNPEVNRIGVAT